MTRYLMCQQVSLIAKFKKRDTITKIKETETPRM